MAYDSTMFTEGYTEDQDTPSSIVTSFLGSFQAETELSYMDEDTGLIGDSYNITWNEISDTDWSTERSTEVLSALSTSYENGEWTDGVVITVVNFTGGTGAYYNLYYSVNLGLEDPYLYTDTGWDSSFEREYQIQYAQPEMDRLLTFYRRYSTTGDSGTTQSMDYEDGISQLISNLTSEALGTSIKAGNRLTSKKAAAPEVPSDDIYSFGPHVGNPRYTSRNEATGSAHTSTSTSTSTSSAEDISSMGSY